MWDIFCPSKRSSGALSQGFPFPGKIDIPETGKKLGTVNDSAGKFPRCCSVCRHGHCFDRIFVVLSLHLNRIWRILGTWPHRDNFPYILNLSTTFRFEVKLGFTSQSFKSQLENPLQKMASLSCCFHQQNWVVFSKAKLSNLDLDKLLTNVTNSSGAKLLGHGTKLLVTIFFPLIFFSWEIDHLRGSLPWSGMWLFKNKCSKRIWSGSVTSPKRY